MHTLPAPRDRCVRITRSGARYALPRARERGDGTLCNVHYHVEKKRQRSARP